MPTPSYELPYEGAKEMLLVDEVDNKEFLTSLFYAMYGWTPSSKVEKKRNKQLRICDEREMNFKNLLPAKKNRD